MPWARAWMIQPSGVATFHRAVLGRAGAPDDTIVCADEARDERCLRAIVQILGRAQLLEASMTHHTDMVRQHQRFRLIVGDIDERGAERSL